MPLVLWANVPIEQRGAPWMTRHRHPRLWLADNGSRLVADGHPEARYLIVPEDHPPPRGWGEMFDAWMTSHQPGQTAHVTCPAAIRSRDGLYHPCPRQPMRGGLMCWQHDPARLAADQERRAERRAAWSDRLYRCNWVGEGVPA